MKQAKRVEKKLNTYLERIIRDVERKTVENDELKLIFKEALEKMNKIHTQQKTDTDKIYSWYAPEVECISKGKVQLKFCFSLYYYLNKFSIVTKFENNFL